MGQSNNKAYISHLLVSVCVCVLHAVQMRLTGDADKKKKMCETSITGSDMKRYRNSYFY